MTLRANGKFYAELLRAVWEQAQGGFACVACLGAGCLEFDLRVAICVGYLFPLGLLDAGFVLRWLFC